MLGFVLKELLDQERDMEGTRCQKASDHGQRCLSVKGWLCVLLVIPAACLLVLGGAGAAHAEQVSQTQTSFLISREKINFPPVALIPSARFLGVEAPHAPQKWSPVAQQKTKSRGG